MKFAVKQFPISHSVRCLAVLFAMIAGCSPGPITGGTSGVLQTDGNPLADVQITIYSANSAMNEDDPLGYGVTSGDGTFELVQRDSTGPLDLEPGSYVVVLESVGAPTELPAEYLKRDSTPLKVDWTNDKTLELNVPGLTLK